MTHVVTQSNEGIYRLSILVAAEPFRDREQPFLCDGRLGLSPVDASVFFRIFLGQVCAGTGTGNRTLLVSKARIGARSCDGSSDALNTKRQQQDSSRSSISAQADCCSGVAHPFVI